MINLKSRPREISHYISQVKSLALSEKEKLMINKIISLNEMMKDPEVVGLISNDLKDDNWVKDTTQLISLCEARKLKTKLLTQHLIECNSFLIYRILEEKFLNTDYIIYEKIEKRFRDDSNLLITSKYLEEALLNSNIHIFLAKANTEKQFKFDLKFIQVNRKKIFSNKLFNSVI